MTPEEIRQNQDVDFNQVSTASGDTLLSLAVHDDQEELVIAFVEAGADPDFTPLTVSPLLYAKLNHWDDLVEKMRGARSRYVAASRRTHPSI